MLQPRTGELQRAKQGAKRSAAMGLELERRPAVWTGRTRVEKGVDLLLKEVSLDGIEELFGLRQGQPEMLDALLVLVEGDDIGDGLFLTLIVTDDKLQFGTHRRASPGSSGRRRVHAILPDFDGFPQHLHALELIRDLDPEAAQRLLDPALQRMMDAVHRYEGTVNQVLGDGIMALFGAPVAHEDHAI